MSRSCTTPESIWFVTMTRGSHAATSTVITEIAMATPVKAARAEAPALAEAARETGVMGAAGAQAAIKAAEAVVAVVAVVLAANRSPS
jgi:hypothetical protein